MAKRKLVWKIIDAREDKPAKRVTRSKQPSEHAAREAPVRRLVEPRVEKGASPLIASGDDEALFSRSPWRQQQLEEQLAKSRGARRARDGFLLEGASGHGGIQAFDFDMGQAVRRVYRGAEPVGNEDR
jgi:hypothetical protein